MKTYAAGIGPAKGSVDVALVEAARDRCLDIYPYTVNASAEMAALAAPGVDGMFTNFLDRLTAVLGGAQSPAKQGGKRAADVNALCRSAG